jgi:hypothetical protein
MFLNNSKPRIFRLQMRTSENVEIILLLAEKSAFDMKNAPETCSFSPCRNDA